VSASPEPFLRATPLGDVRADPIKGTRPRGATPEDDRTLARELIGSAKDRAENVMIVDVLRNDLGRVCVPGTVRVPRLLRLEPTARRSPSTSAAASRGGATQPRNGTRRSPRPRGPLGRSVPPSARLSRDRGRTVTRAGHPPPGADVDRRPPRPCARTRAARHR